MNSDLKSVTSITYVLMLLWPLNAIVHKSFLSHPPLLRLCPYEPLISGSAKLCPLIKRYMYLSIMGTSAAETTTFHLSLVHQVFRCAPDIFFTRAPFLILNNVYGSVSRSEYSCSQFFRLKLVVGGLDELAEKRSRGDDFMKVGGRFLLFRSINALYGARPSNMKRISVSEHTLV